MRAGYKKLRRFCRALLPAKKYDGFVYIIGAQKAGTTSLHSYLVRHPGIVAADRKELHFFDRDDNYNKGVGFYLRMFPAFTHAALALDASPSYLHRIHVAERIKKFRADSKFIVVLREPVSRAFSAYNMYLQNIKSPVYQKWLRGANEDSKAFYQPLIDGTEDPSLEYFLSYEMAIINGHQVGEEPALIRRGIYAPQLERYFKLFGRENVLVLFSDDLLRDPESVTKDVFKFIGLKPIEGQTYPLKHVRQYVADNDEKELIIHYAGEMFKEDKSALQNQHGIMVPWS